MIEITKQRRKKKNKSSESQSESNSEDEADNRSFQEENLEIDSEVLANALSDCDVSNIEHKIEFLKNFILSQNKDYFKETGLPSKLENNILQTQEMSLYLKQNFKTSLTNNDWREWLGKENAPAENETVLANRSKFVKKKGALKEVLNKGADQS